VNEAGQAGGEHPERLGQPLREPGRGESGMGHEAAEHGERPLGEVDHLGDPEDGDEAAGQEGEAAAEGDAGDQVLDQRAHARPPLR
jgi:hypothetical protein